MAYYHNYQLPVSGNSIYRVDRDFSDENILTREIASSQHPDTWSGLFNDFSPPEYEAAERIASLVFIGNNDRGVSVYPKATALTLSMLR